MASLDIFNDDAFALTQLTSTIVDIPRLSTPLNNAGLFREYGINGTTMFIERKGSSLALVPSAPRGGVRQYVKGDGRKVIPVAAIHLPQGGEIMADEVLGVRAFGSETEVEAVQTLVRNKLTKMKNQLDLTLEYHRLGALMGQVKDVDGSVLLDMYTLFGMTQQEINMEMNTTTTDIKQKCVDIKRAIRKKLGGRAFTGVKVLCSQSFFDKLTSHSTVKKAFELFNQNSYARTDQSGSVFHFAGVDFEEYSGGYGDTDFIPADEAYAYPTGVSGLFETAYAPGDYMETVNTNGLPYYARQELKPMGKGVDLESQSNPINLCTLPETVLKLNLNT